MTMKCSKFKSKSRMKRVVASFLAMTMIGFQANLVSFASNITGITGNNGVYNIDPAKVNGSTGFRHYTNFQLDQGHTANLIFNGINRFINAVDNQVTINGILNTVNGNGAFANGRAIFVSPNGFVVGSSGVVNVGSLGVYTPSTAAYNSFKNLDVSQMTDALLNSDQFYGQGNITINGMVLTKEGMTLSGRNIDLNNSKIATGFVSNNAEYSQEAVAQISQSDIANARNNAGRLFELIVNGGQNDFSSSDVDFGVKNGNIAINGIGNYSTRNATMVANGDVNVKMNNNNTSNNDSYVYNHVIDGKTYVANDFNFDSAVTETFVDSFGNRTSNKTNVVVLGDVNAKNISISNKQDVSDLTNKFHDTGSFLRLQETGKLNAKETVNLENTGIQMVLLGDINVDNQSNVEGAGVNIKSIRRNDAGSSFGTYIAGDITINNGDLSVINVSDVSDVRGGAGNLAFDTTADINVTNGDVYIAQNSASSDGNVYLFNNINIKESGNFTLENNVQYGTADTVLKGNINLENGDVNIIKSTPSGEVSNGHILHYGSTIANGNINIENNSGSIIANGTMTSTNNGSANYSGINIETTETSKGGLSVGGKLTSDKDINIVHNGDGSVIPSGLYETFSFYYSDGNQNRIDWEEKTGQYESMYSQSNIILQSIGDRDKGAFNEAIEISGDPNYWYNGYNYYGDDISNVKDLYIADSAVLESKGVNGVVSLTRTGSEGGVNINGSIISAGGVDVINSGNRGIMFNNAINAAGTTFINDTGIADININNAITTGGLVVQNDNEGDINLTGTVNANGDVLVQNNTTGAINLAGTLNNGTTQGTTQIVNEASNTGGINVSGTLGAQNATTITNKGNSLINITGDVVDNVAGITVEQTNSGANGGIAISKDITTDGYLTLYNDGQQGITLANGTNTTSGGKTTIKDTSNVAINVGNNTNINAGSLAVIKEGQGGINMQGVVNSAGDTLVANYGTDSINISNTFAGGKTTIYNDVNGSDLNISGSVTTNGDTLIVQGAEGAFNITGAINNTSQGNTVISNVNGSSFNVGNMNTNGFTLIENSSNTDIALNGNINANNGDLSIQNQNYQIAINKSDVETSDAVSLTRNSVASTNNNGGIVANGTLAGNNVYIQNSGANGISTNNNITASGNLMITSDNAGINLQNGNISGNSVIVSASNNTTGGINVGSNIISQEMLLLENAGSGNIIVNGNLTGSNGNVLIENQTYDITTPHVSFNNDYIVLDVNRVNQASQNTNGGIFTTGAITGGNVYIQNSGSQGIEANSNITSQGDVLITNNAGSIDLVGKNIIGNNVTVSNSNNANGGITVGSNITAQNGGMLTIENAAPGSIVLNGNLNANGGYVIVENQTYDITTPRASFNND